MERCWRANANARPPTPPPAIATVAFVVGDCGAPATMPRPAHVSQRLRGGGPPVRRRLRDLVYMLPTLPHASQARQASTAAAWMQCCRHRSRARAGGAHEWRNAAAQQQHHISIVIASRGVCAHSLIGLIETEQAVRAPTEIPYRVGRNARRARARRSRDCACKLQQRHLAGVRDQRSHHSNSSCAQLCTAIASTCTAA